MASFFKKIRNRNKSKLDTSEQSCDKLKADLSHEYTIQYSTSDQNSQDICANSHDKLTAGKPVKRFGLLGSKKKKLTSFLTKLHSVTAIKTKKQKSASSDAAAYAVAQEDEDDSDIYDDASDVIFEPQTGSTTNQPNSTPETASMRSHTWTKASNNTSKQVAVSQDDLLQLDIPTFLHTPNCERHLIDETRRLLRERFEKNQDLFYAHDYKRMIEDDWTVTRFLLRRRLDPKRTAKLMEECAKFRKQFMMSEIKLSEFPIEFHKAGGLFEYAPDRVGNVTVYMRVKMYRRVPEISDVFKAFILCVIERCDVTSKGRGTAVVFDLSSCSLQNIDLGFLSWLLSSFRNYCPKGLSYILVYNLPWFLNATCKLAMTWMSTSNRRALRFAHGREIENFIEPKNLPDYLGGTCKLNYRAIPKGARPATEVCGRLQMSPEQALKIRELFKEYLVDSEEDNNGDGGGCVDLDKVDADKSKINDASNPNTCDIRSNNGNNEPVDALDGYQDFEVPQELGLSQSLMLVTQASKYITSAGVP